MCTNSCTDRFANLHWNTLHNVLALLARYVLALALVDQLALLLLHVLGHRPRHLLAHLLGYILALLAGLLDVTANLHSRRIRGAM